jgi:hypothetical protein
MSGERVLILCAAITFLVGALAPVLFVGPASPRAVNWLCLGLSFLSFALFLNQRVH